MTMTLEDTTTAITIPLDEAIKAFAGLLPHASKDTVSEVLTGIRVDGATMVATDRYTVGRWTLTNGAEDEASTFLIPRAVAEWVTKITEASLRFGKATGTASYTVRIETGGDVGESNVQASIFYGDGGKPERSQMFNALTPGLNYPPVARLFPTDEDRDNGTPARAFGFSAEHLEKVTGWAKRYGEKGFAIRFEFREDTATGKPKPVYFKIGQLDGLIQPNLLLSA